MGEEQVTGQGAAEQAGAQGTDAAGAVGAAEATQETQSGQTGGDQVAGEEKSLLPGEKPAEESGEKTGEKGEEKGEGEKPEKRAPEEYQDFSVPEGMKLEGEDLVNFKDFAKDQDLTQEQAQKVLEYAGPKIKAMVEQPYKAWKELTEQWWKQTEADPEIGDTKLAQSRKDAAQAFLPGEANPFFKSEGEVQAIREALKLTGAMHHPEVQRLFVRMGRLLAEPGHLTGKPAAQNKQDALLKSMYPTMSEE